MKAVVCYNDGSPDVLKYEEIEKPIVADDEVLVKICAASVNPLDGFPIFVARVIGRMAWLLKPKPIRLGTPSSPYPGSMQLKPRF